MLGEYINLGTFKGFDFTDELASIGLAPMTLFILPAGGFFVLGVIIAVINKLASKKPPEKIGCAGCPNAKMCKGDCE